MLKEIQDGMQMVTSESNFIINVYDINSVKGVMGQELTNLSNFRKC